MSRSRKKRSRATIFLLFVLIAGLVYLYIREIKRVDYSQQSQNINEAINEALITLGITDADILKIYREEKKGKNKKWVHVTKEIKIPRDADFSRYQKGIISGLKGIDTQIFSTRIDDVQNTLTIEAGIQEMVMQTLIFKKIAAHRVAIIIDDAGYNKDKLSEFFEIKIPLTMAILPGEKYSKEIALEVMNKGYQIMLHLPMEPYGYPEIDPGSNALLTDMSGKKIRDLVKANIESVPGIYGVNNHMGSKFTENRKKMKEVLKVIKEYNLFYIDSKTSPDSIGYEVARELGIKTAERQVFIDNKDDIDYIKGQLQELINIALKDGQAIGIGHVQKEMTPRAINQMLPEFKKQGVTIVFVSELVQ